MNKKPVVSNRTLSEGVLPCSDKVEKGFFIGPEGGYIKACKYSPTFPFISDFLFVNISLTHFLLLTFCSG